MLAAALLGGCAGRGNGGASELATALAGRTAGAPQRCIGLTSGSPQIVGEALVYAQGRRLWVSETVGGCPSLRGDPIPIIEVHGGQLCANDRLRTVQRGGIGIPGPYCRVGPFVPYTTAGD